MSKEKFGFDRVRNIFFFSLIIILAIALLYVIRPFLYPVFWAAVIAMLFHPLYERLDKYLKLPSLSALSTLVLVVIIIFLPLTLLSTLLINESVGLYQTVSHWNFSSQLQDATQKLNNTPLAPVLSSVQSEWGSYAADAAKTISVFLFNNIKSITENSLRFIFMLFIMFYSLFYFLKDGTELLKQIMHLSPLGDEHEIMLYEKFRSTARATLKGTFIVGGVQGIIGGILFWATGIEGALIWSVIMIIFATIPAIGPSIVWFPAGIIMLALGNFWQGLVILLFGFFVISTIDNFIRPKLVGRDIQMHPLLVLFSTLGGIFFFGISGFVIGPVIASLFVAVMAIYDHHYRNELQNN
ncbi:MAG: AI-2E family transporter [Candidatus Magasanikbacteria bacterium]|nr:AI-2E family transporter [Candidatus Magasanikbacteria bacterium]